MAVSGSIVGAMSALVTPFKDGELDFETYEYLIKRQIKYGMDACVPVGTTGESATLTHKEHMECIELAVDVCKNTNTSVIAGAGSNSTKEAIELAQFAQKCGADAILCVTPYYNRPTQEGLFLHYKEVANSVDIPLVLYNVPSRTGVNIEIDTALRLFREVRNVYAIKEASALIDRIISMHNAQRDFIIFSGDDMLNLSILANGGRGIISVTGNLLPEEISNLSRYAQTNNLEKMKEISNKLYDINSVLFIQSNPILLKAAMYLSGLMPCLEYRLPLCKPSNKYMDLIAKILERYEVKK